MLCPPIETAQVHSIYGVWIQLPIHLSFNVVCLVGSEDNSFLFPTVSNLDHRLFQVFPHIFSHCSVTVIDLQFIQLVKK